MKLLGSLSEKGGDIWGLTGSPGLLLGHLRGIS
jgi:hypothetical protein